MGAGAASVSEDHGLLSWPFFFFFNDPATPEIYTLSLHDALPICSAASKYSAACTTIPYSPYAAASDSTGVDRSSTACISRSCLSRTCACTLASRRERSGSVIGTRCLRGDEHAAAAITSAHAMDAASFISLPCLRQAV